MVKKFSKEKFKVFHPGGNIGKSLLLAKDIMVTGRKMPIVNFKSNLKNALKEMNKKKLGMLVIIRKKNIQGIVTDGNLRREIKNYSNNKDLSKFVTKTPFVVNENMPASKVLSIMAEKRITSLLVVSDKDFLKKKDKKLKGIIHIHFLLRNGIN